MKTKTSLLITMLIFMSMLSATSIKPGNSAIIKVPDQYSTIQAAIDAAAPGDTIQVAAQTYKERLFVNKAVSLIGEKTEDTIIDGSGEGNVVDVYADDVYISGFTIRNSRRGGSEFYSGVRVRSVSNIVITGNVITDIECGLWLEDAWSNVVSYNAITHGTMDAMYLGNSSSNTVVGNTMMNNTWGMWLEWSSSNNIIRGNTITNSSKGIRLGSNSDNNIVYDNTFKDDDEGIDLSSSFNTVYENTFRGNLVGVYSSASGEVENVLYRNNFINNTIPVSLHDASVVKAWDNGLEGNHWSDYTGQDLDGDGIGDTDTPHRGFDWHPLIDPWSMLRMFNVISNGQNYIVTTLSNSTIASFNLSQSLAQIGFNATGVSGSLGFCNATVPKALLQSEPPKSWTVTVDGVNVVFNPTENSTHTSLYFAYAHSTHRVQIRVSEVENVPPTADFSYSPTDPTLYDTINFTDLSTDSDGNIVSWLWDFRDNSNSTEQNPRHKYGEAGKYTVTLTVEDDWGIKTMTSKIVEVRKVGTTLAIDAPSTVNQGERFTITATLKDENENPIPDATIGFYLLEQGKRESIGSQDTNTSGAAAITYTPLLAAGTYQFEATFNETQILAESSNTFTIEITVAATGFPWWGWIVLPLGLVITALAVIFIRRKRQASALKR